MASSRKRRHGVVDPPDIQSGQPLKKTRVVTSNVEENEVVEYLESKGFARDVCQAFKGVSVLYCVCMCVKYVV